LKTQAQSLDTTSQHAAAWVSPRASVRFWKWGATRYVDAEPVAASDTTSVPRRSKLKP
jgi:hypothetical protein